MGEVEGASSWGRWRGLQIRNFPSFSAAGEVALEGSDAHEAFGVAARFVGAVLFDALPGHVALGEERAEAAREHHGVGRAIEAFVAATLEVLEKPTEFAYRELTELLEDDGRKFLHLERAPPRCLSAEFGNARELWHYPHAARVRSVELVELAERGCAALDAIREREATVEALHIGVHGLAECREGGVAPKEFSKGCWQFGGWRRGQFRGQLGGRRRGALQR